MVTVPHFPRFRWAVVGVALVLACGGGGGKADVPADLPAEVPADVSMEVVPDASPEVPAEVQGDLPGEVGDAAIDSADAADVPDAPEATADTLDPFDVEVATTPGGLPFSLPFVYERAAVGAPPTAQDIADTTAAVTQFWKDIDYFTWATDTSSGMHASTGFPDYLIWWHDKVAVKAGDTVTFRASAADGGSHNNAVPTSVVLASALSGHLLGGDEAMRFATEQYLKSFIACQRGFVFDANDPVDWLISRHIVGRNHSYTLPSGRKKAVEYDEWYFAYTGWNADRFHYPDNPTWGDIWVTNKRSKDDIPYLWRVGAWLPYLVELSKDETVRAVAADAYDLLKKGAKDIVDSGWKIRTKDAEGKIFIPETEDLASFVAYTDLIPDAECDGRLSTALMGYGDTRDQDCGSGQGSLYDDFAATGHFFNYDIIVHFHEVAVLLALTTGHREEARALLEGLATRLDRYQDPASSEPGRSEEAWERHVATWLLRAAVVGLPLTAAEARLVQKYHLQSVASYREFKNWDLWDASVPDGVYSFRDGFHPGYRPDSFQIEDFATLLEYCWSPFKNPAGVPFVDCDVVKDPARWGTSPDVR